VGINPSRAGALRVLERMGAVITLSEQHLQAGEPVADIHVKAGRPLSAVTVDLSDLATASDEVPLLLVAAACAVGHSRFTGLDGLRRKEEDPVAQTAQLLQQLGVRLELDNDRIEVTGGCIEGGEIMLNGQIRVAMAALAAGLCGENTLKIGGCGCLLAACPDLIELMQRLGLNVHKEEG